MKGIPLQVIEDPKEVNAFAGCSQKGGAFMGITAPLLLIMARTSEARAFDELYGTGKYAELSNGIATEVKAQKTVSGPPAGFLPLPQALDPRKLARQNFLFDEQVAFVLGHELAHHYRGHTGCANGASTSGITPQDVAACCRAPSHCSTNPMKSRLMSKGPGICSTPEATAREELDRRGCAHGARFLHPSREPRRGERCCSASF